ncbi:hypothetical protein SETIT_9G456300v2 [Setaria italica]|uniref:Uncharacterized protein n=2 Tax=Setaria TaxID=4554 RepID=A0A368SSV6_SETIT|nr:hypothetical protein SETIT_9G456300v2 [Setaria italica]
MASPEAATSSSSSSSSSPSLPISARRLLICGLAKQFPELRTLRSCDLSPLHGTQYTGSRRGQRCTTWMRASSSTTRSPHSSQATAATAPNSRRQSCGARDGDAAPSY